MDVSALEAEALRLEPEVRARLAERLFESLSTFADPETDRLWAAGALARDEEIEAGIVEPLPADDVLREARLRLR